MPEQTILGAVLYSWRSPRSDALPEKSVRVETYSGFKADERPLRLHLAGRTLEVSAVEDRWYSPGETYFRVLTEDGDRYVLRHTEAQDVWTLTAYRSKSD